jgi:hypothetical protein
MHLVVVQNVLHFLVNQLQLEQKDLALTAITTLFLPGTLSGSLLELGGIAANWSLVQQTVGLRQS